jgi:hypothetical protein
MSNEDAPILYDFIIAVEKVDVVLVRIRDNMRRGWDPIERRAIELVKLGFHEPYSVTRDTEFRLGGSWIATAKDQAEGAFQMLPGYCRECGEALGPVEIRSAVTICESCDRKETSVPDPGLYAKYLVFKNDGDPMKNLVGDCFVLRPASDPAAYEALWEYMERIKDDPDKKALASDLHVWLTKIADDNREKHAREASEQEKQG